MNALTIVLALSIIWVSMSFFVNFKFNICRIWKECITKCSCNDRLEATVSEPGC